MDGNFITLDEFKKMPEYQTFIKDNPSTGTLKVQAFTTDQAIPIPNTQVFITKDIGGINVLFFEGITNMSGIIDNIVLPAPSGEYDVEKYEVPKYTTYDIIVSNALYKALKQYQIAMFGDVKVLQYIKMTPNGDNRYCD